MPDPDDTPKVRRATLGDVARRANVSTSAVSRAFTPGGSVSKTTRQKILKAAREVGFQPNVLARSLATGRSHMIALVTNAFGNPFINSVIDVFTTELQDQRLLPLTFNLKGNFDWGEAVNLILQYKVDGVIVASSTVDEVFLERIHDSEIHLIQAFGRYQGDREIDSVFVDNVGGGAQAARELLDRGYRAPGFIGLAPHVSTSRDRQAGFTEVLEAAGITPRIARAERYAYGQGQACALELFRTHPELDAVFCADDLLGLGALDALRHDLGRDVPETGVIGFNGIEATGWSSHPLATFRAEASQVVLNAIDMLTERIEAGRRPREHRIVSARFVERASIRPRPAPDA
ncbi:LacI family DNA-binding transcriptional regulator [Pseudoponticoccus marisrubri]|uniref:HTH lacI-type domain-containing protein n=1 Tax=Pseudoponticoccus marisrubri TaxID=1685382 RepID=A0A0W7WNN1_9RHOB|nr:LacI family DNA-binding transcriptional regulator [Pseudoponticoccus marisrubri]KUF12119.1 hypothetical protein AVJ23_05995 [Pseudoponticoccus marisrubri]